MRNVPNRMKNEIIFFAIFIFRVMVENSSKIGVILSTKMIISRKIKNVKIGNLIFLSIQPIPDLSCKFEKFQFFFKIFQIYMKDLESAE